MAAAEVLVAVAVDIDYCNTRRIDTDMEYMPFLFTSFSSKKLALDRCYPKNRICSRQRLCKRDFQSPAHMYLVDDLCKTFPLCNS